MNLVNTPLQLEIDGVNTRTYGVYLAEDPKIFIPEKRITTYVVPGYSGTLTSWKGDYNDTDLQLTLLVEKRQGSHWSTVKENLLKSQTLRMSTDWDKLYDVRYTSSDVSQLNHSLNHIAVTFNCKPLKREAVATTYVGSNISYSNTGDIPTIPILEFTGSELVTINYGEQTITIQQAQGKCIIDWLSGIAIDDTGSIWRRVVGKMGTVLPRHSIDISATVELTVKSNWRYL